MIYLPKKLQKALTFFKLSKWIADAWKEASVETIKNCSEECSIIEETSEDEDDIVDEEFNALFNELADSKCDMKAEEYVDSDVETCSSLSAINSNMVDWRVSSIFKQSLCDWIF